LRATAADRSPPQRSVCISPTSSGSIAQFPVNRQRIGFATGTRFRTAIASTIITSALLFSPALAQSGKSPGEIAASSKLLAERHEGCRVEAKQQRLHLLKRRTFMRARMK
jgi:hypothetical protein